MAADHDLIKGLSTAGSALISSQIGLARSSVEEATDDPWMLGYCYGFVDAVCQASNLPEETEFLLLLTVTFDNIAGGGGELKLGADLVEKALKKLQEESFQQGVMQGGADYMGYRTNQNVPPMGFVEHMKQKS